MASSDEGQLLEEENPFRMPTEEEIFARRDEEKKRKQEEREVRKNQPIYMKTTWSSRMATTSNKVLKDIAEDVANDEYTTGKKGVMDAANSAVAKERRKEKENMADFIQKKREMFLVQMSLDTKRAEIRKLEEQAAQREEALKKSEQMLEDDALRFDSFLKENDFRAVEAIKRAEQEAKLRMDRVQEIKKLNSQITAIRSDMSKYEEQLEECKKDRDFLWKLTPDEWKKEQLLLRKQRRTVAQSQDHEKGREKDRDNSRKEEMLDLYPDDLDGLPMYFKHPRQLLDIYAALEESNLFLIQNSQETEEALEELKQKLQETKERMEKEKDQLNSVIVNLRRQIREEDEKANALAERAKPPTSQTSETDIDSLLEELKKQISEVYERCGFENDSINDSLGMLGNIEARLEEYLAEIDTMSPDIVEELEKQKEKDRRAQARSEKIKEDMRRQGERLQKALKRSTEPAAKRTGKPVMFRSAPVARKKKEDENASKKGDEEEEIKSFFQ